MVDHRSEVNNGMFVWLKWASTLSARQAAIKQNLTNALGDPNYDKDDHQFYFVDKSIPFAKVKDLLDALSNDNRGLCVFPHGTDENGCAQLSIHCYGHLRTKEFQFSNMSNGMILLAVWSNLGTKLNGLTKRTSDFRAKFNVQNQQDQDRQISVIYSWKNISIYKIGKSKSFEHIEKFIKNKEYFKASDIAISLFPHGFNKQASTMSIKLDHKALAFAP